MNLGNTSLAFVRAYSVSMSAALYMLVGATDGAFTVSVDKLVDREALRLVLEVVGEIDR